MMVESKYNCMEDIEMLVDKIASFLEQDENWIDLINVWRFNDRSEDLRRLLREAIKSDFKGGC